MKAIQLSLLFFIISITTVGCGIEIQTEEIREGNFASYEVFRVDTYGSSGEVERIDKGCIDLDTSFSDSVATIYRDDEYGDVLSFHYQVVDDTIGFSFTTNSQIVDEGSTLKENFIYSSRPKEVIAELNGYEFHAKIQGPGCLY